MGWGGDWVPARLRCVFRSLAHCYPSPSSRLTKNRLNSASLRSKLQAWRAALRRRAAAAAETAAGGRGAGGLCAGRWSPGGIAAAPSSALPPSVPGSTALAACSDIHAPTSRLCLRTRAVEQARRGCKLRTQRSSVESGPADRGHVCWPHGAAPTGQLGWPRQAPFHGAPSITKLAVTKLATACCHIAHSRTALHCRFAQQHNLSSRFKTYTAERRAVMMQVYDKLLQDGERSGPGEPS